MYLLFTVYEFVMTVNKAQIFLRHHALTE